MSLKEELIAIAIAHHESISHLCHRFNISRKTAYKWLKRFKEEGLEGLEERSKKPIRSPSKVNGEVIDRLLELREERPAWGARKLRQFLINQGQDQVPSEASVNRILKRHHKIDAEASKKRIKCIRFEHERPNDLWQMDFKGYFRTEEGKCHPLTILDDHSRYAICLQACAHEQEPFVRRSLEKAFREYGLPKAMTMDNGPPWLGSHPHRFSKLTIWLMRLGIRVGHSSPYHPQTQGKDERFHRSLKEEVLKFHRFKGLIEAQKAFDEWRQEYNDLRPHEGINMLCPSDRYQRSMINFPDKLMPIDYQPGDVVRKVRSCGQISFEGENYFIGEFLHGEYVALRQVSATQWNVYFVNTRVGKIIL